jgi:hypothetical protein
MCCRCSARRRPTPSTSCSGPDVSGFGSSIGNRKGHFMIASGLLPGALGGTRTPNLLIRRVTLGFASFPTCASFRRFASSGSRSACFPGFPLADPLAACGASNDASRPSGSAERRGRGQGWSRSVIWHLPPMLFARLGAGSAIVGLTVLQTAAVCGLACDRVPWLMPDRAVGQADHCFVWEHGVASAHDIGPLGPGSGRPWIRPENLEFTSPWTDLEGGKPPGQVPRV